MNSIQNFLDRTLEHPSRVAIVDANGETISFRDLERRSARLAHSFRARGIAAGDRVLVGMEPGIDLYAGLAGLWRIGAVAVFPEPSTGLKGFRHAAASTKPKALLAKWPIRAASWLFPETRRIATGLPTSTTLSGSAGDRDAKTETESIDLSQDAPALVSFTSGSTGLPKGMERSHGFMLARHAALSTSMKSDRPEVVLVAFPAFVLTCLSHGMTCVMPNWDVRRHDRATFDEIADVIEKHDVTRLLVPPAIVEAIADRKLPSSVRDVMTSGGPLFPETARRFIDRSPDVGLTVVYGSPEAEPIAHARVDQFDPDVWIEIQNGGGLPVGRLVPEIAMKIHDGEIVVSGPHVNRGYLDPSRDRETKIVDNDVVWHRTGDLGRLDDFGNLWLLGRVASAAAEGRAPFPVEAAARSWRGVRNAVFSIRENGEALLYIAGDERYRRQWRWEAERLGVEWIVSVDRIPMDPRHRAKPDMAALERERWRHAGKQQGKGMP